jgi:hypothetical protein
MISPEEIRIRARRLWESGRPLRSLLEPDDDPLFPFGSLPQAYRSGMAQ